MRCYAGIDFPVGGHPWPGQRCLEYLLYLAHYDFDQLFVHEVKSD
jgi:hypothetical protein